jgi:hypothetical protein
MLEYERQADERSREQDAMNEERERMLEEQARMRAEQERIAQEEYEMRQYYEAEALKHAEEVRIHQEGMYPYAQIRIRRKKLTKYTRSPKAPRSGPGPRAAGAGPRGVGGGVREGDRHAREAGTRQADLVYHAGGPYGDGAEWEG